MKWLVVAAVLPLAGCGSIFDPAPYDPLHDQAVLNGTSPASTSATILAFAPKPTDASQKMLAIANGYAAQRDNLMRQQLLFDIPMIGLGAAAIVNPLFNGAKNVTLGLSLGAAVEAGGRIYFGPQAKEAAYGTAWQAFTCLAFAANDIVTEMNGDGAAGPGLVTKLSAEIKVAEASLTGNAGLLAAYNQAQKSLSALETALGTLNAGSYQLEKSSLSLIVTATNSVTANVQNVAAATAPIAAVKPASTPGPAPAPALAVVPGGGAPDIPTQTANLQNDAAAADAITQRINSVMAEPAKCAPGS